ncbi:uncharacterized protein LOC108138671 [Drosophila elegans]|uniref:uncharacterized protein LOC108138671 n=1 Tax=Drosophila elegans TaxID=30023 RepID=UPI0007E85044|nr:uncharacterized protein LOC108138671 [Drosophila elegans]
MPSAKEKTLRKERILQFIRENRELRPINSNSVLPSASPRKEETLRQKKRVTFTHGKQQRSFGESSKTRDNDKVIGQGLTSCLITKPSDTRLTSGDNNPSENSKEIPRADSKCQLSSSCRRSSDSRLMAGANNPAVRHVGRLPRTDSECQFKEPGIFFLQNVHSDLATQEVKLNSKPLRKELKNKCDFFPKYVENRPFNDVATQTLYRESSAQTLAFLPEVQNRERNETVELFSLAKLLPGDKPPGLHEVELLERSRRRWNFKKALKANLQRLLNEARQVSMQKEYTEILEAFEWEHWIQREEDIQECQMMRLEIVIKMFDKREKEMHAASKSRIEKTFEGIQKRRLADLHKNEVEYQRGMRRIGIQLAKTSRKWEKQSPMQALGSRCSEFYGPLTRHGVDPARRSFESSTGRKAFDMRIDDLEKRVNMRNVQCPFSKLKEWSKPKEYDREYERNFCNDGNLQRLYESLKTLRTQADMSKDSPNCLKTRLRIEHRAPSTDSSDSYHSYNMLARKTRMTEYSRATSKVKSKVASKVAPKADRQRDSLRGRQDLENLICSYEGSYIGSLMQFLSNEMQRLKEQRKLHFFSILAQKERWRREAAEAGLRQKENAMRLMYEEMFQFCNVVHGETAQKYADNIFTTDINHMMEDEAAETVAEMAKQIDADIERWLESFKLIQNPHTFTSLRLMLQDMVCPDLNAVLQGYEASMITQYIVEDVIFDKVWQELEPYDIASTLTSDLIDRLIDNDLYLFSSSESESEGPQKVSWYEAHAIMRKLIRQAVPGRRWKEENERIATEVYNSLFDDVFDEILFKFENPSDDLLELCSSKSFAYFQHEIPRRQKSELKDSRSDSMQNTKLLKTQFLSLAKKFKYDDITAKLETDEKFKLINDSSLLDFIKSEELQQTKILSTQHTKIPSPELFSIKSTVDLAEHLENLRELRGSSLIHNNPMLEQQTFVENIEGEIKSSSNDEDLEKELEKAEEEKEEFYQKEGSATTTNDDEFEEEHSEVGEEVVVYYPKDSQLFKFR